jgi:hypothetical protein
MSFIGDPDMSEDFGTGLSFGWAKIRNTEPSHRTWLDVFLLCMEVLAVIGLIVIVMNSLSMVDILNRSVVVAPRQPALEPTPIVQEVVLPEGHTPPNSLG